MDKGAGKDNANTVVVVEEKKKDSIRADGKAPKLEVAIKVDGKEERDGALYPHTTMPGEQPRRLVNQQQ